jgi:hypothetical protein
VTWTLADRRRAHVRVIVTADGRTLDRDLDFTPGDADTERGRTIGLAIVAMVPEPAPKTAEPAAPVEAAPMTTTTTTATTTPIPRKDVSLAVHEPLFGLDVFGLAASGPLGIGGGLAGRFLPFPSPRASASLRSGPIADATLRSIDLTIGLAPQLFDGLGARVELGVTQQSVTREGDEQSRLVGSARVLGEATWWTMRSVGFGIAAGMEVAFGETRVLVGDTPVASIPRARFILELSLRARK